MDLRCDLSPTPTVYLSPCLLPGSCTRAGKPCALRFAEISVLLCVACGLLLLLRLRYPRLPDQSRQVGADWSHDFPLVDERAWLSAYNMLKGPQAGRARWRCQKMKGEKDREVQS